MCKDGRSSGNRTPGFRADTQKQSVLSFANVKERNYTQARRKICQIRSDLYSANGFLAEADILDDRQKSFTHR